MPFKTADEAIEARTQAAARIYYHLLRAAGFALNDCAIGSTFDAELLLAAQWRVRWDAATEYLIGLDDARDNG